MLKEDVLNMRDLVSVTVHDLVYVTVDIEKELIIILMFDKKIELPIAKLKSHENSAKEFIGYLKEKLSE